MHFALICTLHLFWQNEKAMHMIHVFFLETIDNPNINLPKPPKDNYIRKIKRNFFLLLNLTLYARVYHYFLVGY